MSDVQFDRERGTLTLGGSRIVFHCHHYNVFLQRSINDALGERAARLQRNAAAEAARTMLAGVFAEASDATFEARIARAVEIFGSLGFGLADASKLGPLGGVVRVSPSHYAIGWLAKFGPSSKPVDHFATGFFRGALCAAAGLAPERVDAEQRSCASAGEGSVTEIVVGVS